MKGNVKGFGDDMEKKGQIIGAMIHYFEGDTRRINHFLKVYGFAKAIGEEENISADTQNILEIAAITHDIGIKKSEEKYQSSSGHYQQIEGPGEARTLLQECNVEKAVIERVCFLIAHHHTYENMVGEDYQILVEADFLVNIFEDEMKRPAIESVKEKIFRTQSGIRILEELYLK